MAAIKPYRGQDSYERQDADLFFGRDEDEKRLVARIRSSTLMLFHAQSGAGKTSLLNARILPGLEASGLWPVRVRLADDPVESTRSHVLQALLPPPAGEIASVERALRLLEIDANAPLQNVVTSFDGLRIRDGRRREILSPVKLDQHSMPDDRIVPAGLFTVVRPWFVRFLGGTLDSDRAAKVFAAIAGDVRDAGSVPFHAEARVSELLEWLETSRAGHLRTVRELYDPAPGLEPFVAHLCTWFQASFSDFSLVLVFDQFEELFTRFADPGPISSPGATGPDWRHRPRFIAELRGLYQAARRLEDPLPLQVVLSMRDDFIARLDDIRAFASELSRQDYHLQMLDLEMVKEAIQRPADLFDYSYSGACYAAMVAELAKENRFVEPPHLQIVCEKLWDTCGRELQGSKGKVELPEFEALGGVGGILDGFLREYLEGLSDRQRVEVLLLLQPLITSGGTRNISAYEDLINAPFRDSSFRNELLRELEDRRIVRVEDRLGQSFVEITHEFIIQPVLDAIRREGQKSQSSYWDLVNGLAILRGLRSRGEGFRELTAQEYATLKQCGGHIPSTFWLASLMARNALRHADGVSAAGWLKDPAMADFSEQQPDTITSAEAARRLMRAQMSGERDEVVGNVARDVLRAVLEMASHHDDDVIRYWAGRVALP